MRQAIFDKNFIPTESINFAPSKYCVVKLFRLLKREAIMFNEEEENGT